MKPNRKISATTLLLVEAMANDMSMSKGYREFQRQRLADLKAAAAKQDRQDNPTSPFARFEQHLACHEH
jgi:hypothetical protein